MATTKYNIEGNIDFFNELYKSLDSDEETNVDDNNLCLITDQPLIDKYVTLGCGHKFNYIPLYNDLVNHKTKFNALEGNSGQLRGNVNRCPYCRNKQEVLLPYYEELGLKKVPGVNVEAKSINVSSNRFSDKICEHLTPNPIFNPNCENPQEIGYLSNCKFLKCYHNYACQIENNYGDDKFYCWIHKKVVLKKYKNADLQKAKEEKEKAKKEKEEAKQKAKEEKQKVKDEKQKAKDELKKMIAEEKLKKTKTNKTNTNKSVNEVIDNIDEENVVISLIDVPESSSLCTEILKTGLKKGQQCGICVYQNNLCKRHYNLKNK